jgi:hypothetical protein
MNTDQMEADRVYSHLQIQQKQIDPATNIFVKLSRNFQLGNIDRKEYEHIKMDMETSLTMHDHPSPLMKKEAQRRFEMIDSRLVLSGSKEGFVRKEINTHTNINKVTQETKGGVFNGVFKRGD